MIIETSGGQFKFQTREDMESDYLVIKEIYEENVYDVHDGHFHTGGTVVDIGANIGCFSVLAASHGAKVFAVEPEPNNLELLKENIKINNFEKQINIVEYGISNFTGTAIINDGGGGASIKDDVSDGSFINIITLDELFSMYKIKKVDVLKIDVEGSELEIIIGASRENLQKCQYVAVEFDIRSGYALGDMVKKLSETHHVRTMGSWERGGMIWAWLY